MLSYRKKVIWQEISCQVNPTEKSIIYVDRNTFEGLGAEMRNNSMQSLKAYHGLNIISKLRRKDIIEEYDLDLDADSLSKDQIIASLASRENTLYSDPYGDEREGEGEILLLSTFSVTCKDLLDCVANDFPDGYIFTALGAIGYDNSLFLRYWHSCGAMIGEGLPEWDISKTQKILHKYLSPKMRDFMVHVKNGAINDANRVLNEFNESIINNIFDISTEDEKIVMLTENQDGILDNIESDGRYPDLCKAARKSYEMTGRKAEIAQRAFAIVPPDICWQAAAGVETVNIYTLESVIEQEKDEGKKSELQKLLVKLKDIESQRENDTQLFLEAIHLSTTVNDVIGCLASMLSDDKLIDKREAINNAIEELRTWPERDVESMICASLDTPYKELLRVCEAKRASFLSSVHPSYFVNQLDELQKGDISEKRRKEVELLIKKINSI